MIKKLLKVYCRLAIPLMLSFFCLSDTFCLTPRVPVFPNAEGYGTMTVAGRKGQILRVTNLNDSGAGSLRAALLASGPRIVVFEVSGYIDLLSDIVIGNPYLTVAGQTAPSPGICLRGGNGIYIKTHDILVQHIAIRSTLDAIAIVGADGTGTPQAYNVVVDHCSLTWNTDENGSTNSDQVRDITWSNNIFAEGLTPHSMGLLLGDGSSRVSVIKNLFAHNYDRNARIQGGKSERAYFQIVNNLIFDAYSISSISNDTDAPYPQSVDAIGNIAIDTATTSGRAMYKFGAVPAGAKFYQLNNLHYTPSYSPSGEVVSGLGGNATEAYSPLTSLTGITVLPSSQVESYVKTYVGARPADRDAIDDKIIHTVTTRHGGFISSPSEVGGYPVLSKNCQVFHEGANPNGDDNGNGYTNVEEILQKMAAQVEGRNNR